MNKKLASRQNLDQELLSQKRNLMKRIIKNVMGFNERSRYYKSKKTWWKSKNWELSAKFKIIERVRQIEIKHLKNTKNNDQC